MILLDTHAWIWWVSSPARLPHIALDAIDDSLERGEPIRVSAISAWEVAMLVELGRLELTLSTEAWIGRSYAAPEIDFLPVDPWVAARSVSLAGFPHRDPADRMIAATAIAHGATLLTADGRLQGYEPLTTLWE